MSVGRQSLRRILLGIYVPTNVKHLQTRTIKGGLNSQAKLDSGSRAIQVIRRLVEALLNGKGVHEPSLLHVPRLQRLIPLKISLVSVSYSLDLPNHARSPDS